MNSIFDPDLSGTGHQPLGHDQWATFYNRYRVFKVSYVISMSTQTGYQNTLCLLPSNDSSVFTSTETMCEQPRAMMKQTSGQGDAIQFKGHVIPSRITGVKPSVYKSDDRYQAVFGASPAEQILLHIGHWSSLYGTQDTHSFLNITLVYHTELFDPKPIGSS